MKVRPLEKKIYNLIQKRQVVPFSLLSYKFGSGSYLIKSPFVENAITAGGLSEELQEALYTLRENGSIFEIAVPANLIFLLTGDIPLNKDCIPTVQFKRAKYRYGYQGYSWLPVVYCSETGLKNLALIYYNVIEAPQKIKVNFISQIDARLNGPLEDRLFLSFYISDLLYGKFSQPFQKRLEDRVKLVKEMGPEKFIEIIDNMKVKTSKTNLVGL